ncbi:MAG: hypothetical protein Kow0037_19640 [Calditrichia bacterium]
MKAWFEEEKYEEIIQEDSDCHSPDENCISEKYYIAYSFYKLGDKKASLAMLKSASEIISAQTPPLWRYKIGLLKQQIVLEYSKSIFDFPAKARLIKKLFWELESLEKLEPLLENTPERNQIILAEKILKAETFLQKMDITPADSLKYIYLRIKPLLENLRALSPNEGYDLYYDLAVKFKIAQPLLKRFIYSGLGDPDELRQLCGKFWLAIKTLKSLPIYRYAYTDQIDYIHDKIKQYALILNEE